MPAHKDRDLLKATKDLQDMLDTERATAKGLNTMYLDMVEDRDNWRLRAMALEVELNNLRGKLYSIAGVA